MQNVLLESRMDEVRDALDRLAQATDDNLRLVLRKLTCDPSVSTTALVDIDPLSRAARERCLLLVAREHPMAHDLKYAMAALRIEHDYERIHDLASHLSKRVSKLLGTPMEDVIQDMTGVMADMLNLHQIVRRTWQRDRADNSLPNLKPQVQTMSMGVLEGVSRIQAKTLAAISDGRGSPEVLVELVLACRHLKRIANMLESIPDELVSFDNISK